MPQTLAGVRRALLALTFCGLAATPCAAATGYTYETLWVDAGVSTSPTGISEDGTIVGSYQLLRGPSLLVRPFSLKDGVYTTYPSIEPASYSFDDINDVRHLVANIGHRDFSIEALFIAGGRKTLLAVPGAIATHAYALNDADTVVGAYEHDPNELGIATTSAFVWSERGGYAGFDAPGAAGLTIAWGINRAGTTVGVYADDQSVYHGFIRSRSGALKTVDYPGSPYTQLMGINDRGDVVGFYQDPADFILKGFVYRGERFTPVGPVDAANGSYPYRITNDGRIVGWYLNASYQTIGFLATPVPP